MRLSMLLGAVFFFAVSVACLNPRFEDVSDSAVYSELIGQVFLTKVPMAVYGMANKVERNPKIESYVLEFEPGHSGPEVVVEVPVAVGTKLVVTKAMQCPDCSSWLYRQSTRFYVELPGSNLDAAKPILFESIYRDVEEESDTGKVEFSPELFTKVSRF